MLVLQKRFLSLENLFLFPYPKMRNKFKNFIQTMRTSVIDKIVGYTIYVLIDPFAGISQFINLNSFSDK